MPAHEIRILADKVSFAAKLIADLPSADKVTIYVPPQSGWGFIPGVEILRLNDPMHRIMTDPAEETIVWVTCPGFLAEQSIFNVKAQRGIVSIPAIFLEDGTTKAFDPPPLGMLISIGTPSVAMSEGISIERESRIRCSIPASKLLFAGRRGIEVDDPDTVRRTPIKRERSGRHRPTAQWSQPTSKLDNTPREASQQSPSVMAHASTWTETTSRTEVISTNWKDKVEIALIHSLTNPPQTGFSNILQVPDNQLECEKLVRSIRCHWIGLSWRETDYDPEVLARSAIARSDREILLFPGMALVNPARVRMLPPLIPDMRTWVESATPKAYLTAFDADGTPLRTDNEPVAVSRGSIKVCVTSMCGVSSAEDRYGLGGEHQVVHWLRDGFLRDSRVELCDIYDTYNSCMAPDGFYDLVLSNSCWARPPKPAPGGISIFWHFNTNCYRGDPSLVQRMGYDVAWTNSPISIEEFRKIGMRAKLKHLNASTEFHDPYPYESTMFKHDAVYLGGYQVEYKGVELIRRYIKQCIGQDFDFAIYGNRKWKYDVQLEALRTDRSFKPEHLDDSYEPVWHGVLHPQDFRILAQNAKIWVNFNSEDQRPLGMCNDRCIWAMYAGAFLITDDTREQRELYGDTCDYSRGGDQLISKIHYWLEHEDERIECAAAARQNMVALGLHTDETARLAMEELER